MSGKDAALLRDETTEGRIAEMIAEIRAMDGRVNDRMRQLHRECAREFAHRNGWKVARAPFAPEQLLRGSWKRKRDENPAAGYPTWDHCEHFSGGGRPVAITSHSYAPREEIERVVAGHGLALRWLAVSWYWPRGARAFVATRA